MVSNFIIRTFGYMEFELKYKYRITGLIVSNLMMILIHRVYMLR